MVNQSGARRRSRRTLAVLAVLGTFAVAACGSSSGSGSVTTKAGSTATTKAGAAASADGVDRAKAKSLVDSATARPTKIGLTTPVGKPIPTGKKLYFVSCGVEVCELEFNVIKKATDILGWSATKLSTDGSPQQIQNAWDQIVREKPDAVLYTATPRSQIEAQMVAATANGTAIAGCCITDPLSKEIIYAISTPEQTGNLGPVIAGWVVNDSATAKPGVLYLNLPDFPILSSLETEFTKTFKELCATCKSGKIDFGLADLAKAGDQVVSYLRANTDTKYVVLSTDSAFAGLNATLKAAGLNDIRIFGEGPSPANIKEIQTGEQAGTMAFGAYELLFGMVDAVARKITGVEVLKAFDPPNWILTKSNIPAEGATDLFPLIPDIQDQFKKLWGK
jgi:ABC-type sugar transport system substrate-binding protein